MSPIFSFATTIPSPKAAPRFVTAAVIAAIGLVSTGARAQDATAQPPAPATYAPPMAYSPPPPAPPETLPYESDRPVPYGYHVASKARKGLVIAGASVFGGGYALAAMAGLANEPQRGWLFVPLAGPIIYASRKPQCGAQAE